MNVPDAVGVPLIVTTLAAHEPVTPAGKPVKVAPVAPVVANVIFVIALFTQTVWLVPAAMVFNAETTTVFDKEIAFEQPGKVIVYRTPSIHVVPFTLVIIIVFVATVVVTVICCRTSFGPALNAPILVVPSEIFTLP